MFVYIIRRPDRSPLCFLRLTSSSLRVGYLERDSIWITYTLDVYVICSAVRFVKISSPNECDKILKILHEKTEPTDYIANSSRDHHYSKNLKNYKTINFVTYD